MFLYCEQAPVKNCEVQCRESHSSWICWWQWREEGFHRGLSLDYVPWVVYRMMSFLCSKSLLGWFFLTMVWRLFPIWMKYHHLNKLLFMQPCRAKFCWDLYSCAVAGLCYHALPSVLSRDASSNLIWSGDVSVFLHISVLQSTVWQAVAVVNMLSTSKLERRPLIYDFFSVIACLCVEEWCAVAHCNELVA